MKAKLLAVFVLMLFVTPALAQTATPPAPVIAVVDMQRILQEAKAAQSVKRQVEAVRDTYQAEIKKEEERLKKQEQELIKSREGAAKEAFAEKQKALRTEVIAVERKIQQRRRALDQGFADAMKKIRQALAEVVVTTAKEAKVNMVMPKGATMWIEPQLEITDVILQRLDAKLADVKVTIPN